MVRMNIVQVSWVFWNRYEAIFYFPLLLEQAAGLYLRMVHKLVDMELVFFLSMIWFASLTTIYNHKLLL